jgi:hypothetical protein
MITIQFTNPEKFNADYAKEQQAKQDIKTALFICSLFSELNETEQVKKGKTYIKAIGGILK